MKVELEDVLEILAEKSGIETTPMPSELNDLIPKLGLEAYSKQLVGFTRHQLALQIADLTPSDTSATVSIDAIRKAIGKPSTLEESEPTPEQLAFFEAMPVTELLKVAVKLTREGCLRALEETAKR